MSPGRRTPNQRHCPAPDPRPWPEGAAADRSRFGQYCQRQFLERASFLLGTPTEADWHWLRRVAYRTDPAQRVWDETHPATWAAQFRRTVPILSYLPDIDHDPRVADESAPFEVMVGIVQNWCRAAPATVNCTCLAVPRGASSRMRLPNR